MSCRSIPLIQASSRSSGWAVARSFLTALRIWTGSARSARRSIQSIERSTTIGLMCLAA